MTDDSERGLRRWSRLKRTRQVEVDRRQGSAAPALPQDRREGEPHMPIPAIEPAGPAADASGDAPADAPELPSLESLTKDSDFSVFLRQGVPEEIRRQALRILWRSDPVLANLDGLNDYDEDYRRIGTVKSLVQTAYKVGKGFLTERDEDEVEDDAKASLPDADDDAAAAEPVAAAGDHVDGAEAAESPHKQGPEHRPEGSDRGVRRRKT